MSLDNKSIRTRHQSRKAHGVNMSTDADTVGWIDYHREVSFFFEDWNCVEVESISIGFFVGADAALAEDDPFITVCVDVLGLLKELLYSS